MPLFVPTGILLTMPNRQRLRPAYVFLHRVFPRASIWPNAIANGHMRAMWLSKGESRRQEASVALRWLTLAHALWTARMLKRSYSDKQRELYGLWRMREIAQAALEAGQAARAEQCALDMLRIPDVAREATDNPHIQGDRSYVYEAHVVLGKVKLKRDDVDAAERHLIEAAGQWPVSPARKTFGPDTELAIGLPREGRADAVVTYLRACGRFWWFGREQIDGWMYQIEAGRVPDVTDQHLVRFTPLRVVRGLRATWREEPLQ
jgi:hypothetical protein